MNSKTLINAAAFSTAFIILYYGALKHIITNSLTADGSHAPLILAVSLYLIWIKRKAIKTLPVKPALLPGAALAFLGCFMLYAGKISGTITIQHVSMVPVILGTIWLLLGHAFFKAFSVPVGYLIFLSGLAEVGLGGVALQLQHLSAWIAAKLLSLTGMPVFLAAKIIELPHISLEVARECSGISHIVSLIALSVPLAYLSQRTPAKKFLVVLAAPLIGIFANGLRIALIGVYALYNQGAELHGPYETFYVSFIFFCGMVVLVIFNQLVRKLDNPPPRGDALEFEGKDVDSCPKISLKNHRESISTPQSNASVILALILFALTLGFIHLHTPQPVPLKIPLDTLPMHIAGLDGTSLHQMDERIRPFAADQELMRRYQDDAGNSFELYVGYFEIQDRERKIIDYRRAWIESHSLGFFFRI